MAVFEKEGDWRMKGGGGWRVTAGIVAVLCLFSLAVWSKGGGHGGGRGAGRSSGGSHSGGGYRGGGTHVVVPIRSRTGSDSRNYGQADPEVQKRTQAMIWTILGSLTGIGGLAGFVRWKATRYDLVSLALVLKRKNHHAQILRRRLADTHFEDPQSRVQFLTFLAGEIDVGNLDSGYAHILVAGGSRERVGELAALLDRVHQEVMEYTDEPALDGAAPSNGGASPERSSLPGGIVPLNAPLSEDEADRCVISMVMSVRRTLTRRDKFPERLQEGMTPYEVVTTLSAVGYPERDAFYLTFRPDENESMTRWDAQQLSRGLEHGDKTMTPAKLMSLPPAAETAASTLPGAASEETARVPVSGSGR